jgi:outer membrane biosynthesis protein TonB
VIRKAGSMRPFASAPGLVCAALLPAALLLASCQKDTDPGPGGVSVGEARALDEAAEMLEQRPAPPLADATVPVEAAAAGNVQPKAAAGARPAPPAKPKPAPKLAAKPKPQPKSAAEPKPKP